MASTVRFHSAYVLSMILFVCFVLTSSRLSPELIQSIEIDGGVYTFMYTLDFGALGP